MKMIVFSTKGEIHDSPNPSLAFPIVDLFSPTGELLDHTYSVTEALQCIKDNHSCNLTSSPVPSDSILDIANRYPGLHLPATRLQGRYTVLLVTAPGCHACEVQDAPFEEIGKKADNINQVLITLSLD